MDNEGILGVDIECTECGKLMALSNAFKYDHKYLCPKCAPDLDEITSSHQIPRGATVRSKTMYEQKLEQKLADLKEHHAELEEKYYRLDTMSKARIITELEQELAELKKLVGELKFVLEIKRDGISSLSMMNYEEGLQRLLNALWQACTLENTDSKEGE